MSDKDFLLAEHESFKDNFGVNVKQFRLLRRWTQEELAERVGVSRLDIGLIERGRKRVHLDLAEKICRVFNTRLSYMVGEERMLDESGAIMMLGRMSLSKRMHYKILLDKLEAAEALAVHNPSEAHRQLMRILQEILEQFLEISKEF